MASSYSQITEPSAGDVIRASFGQDVADNFDVLAYCGLQAPLGGSQSMGLVTGAATWVPVETYIEHSLNGDELGGLTLEARVWTATSNASTAVQVRLRNTTDSSNAAISTSHTSTTVTAETLSVTLAAGAKTYRLEILGDATNEVFGWGVLRFRKVP